MGICRAVARPERLRPVVPMIGTPYATRCALLALLVSVAALAFDVGRDIGRAGPIQPTLTRTF
jgi:hypothetical protein